MGGIELLNKLKPLIESIYPRYDDLLRKPIPVAFGLQQKEMRKFLTEMLWIKGKDKKQSLYY
ncbi:11045_t:CDS:2 [Entrophospora sp. SA101]|nr:11045_t:CDS:2 [Entrophospora sp. SA101]